MEFEWTVPKIFADIPDVKYINDCCIGCDDVLNQIKSEIASQMKIDENQLAVYQEDWGWALEFAKDEVFYFLGLNNVSQTENRTDFTVNIEANRKIKKFLFTKKVEAANELTEFAEIVSNAAKRNGFQVS